MSNRKHKVYEWKTNHAAEKKSQGCCLLKLCFHREELERDSFCPKFVLYLRDENKHCETWDTFVHDSGMMWKRKKSCEEKGRH